MNIKKLQILYTVYIYIYICIYSVLYYCIYLILYNESQTFVDVLHIRKTESGRLRAEDSRVDKNSEYYTSFEEGNDTNEIISHRNSLMEEMARDPNIYEKLTQSIAPSIYKLDDAKKGILCMLFGGTNKPPVEGNTTIF